MAVLVYVVLLPTTASAVLEILNSAGPLHSVFTITETSTAGLNSIVQVRLMFDPMGRMGLELLLVTTTESGPGTETKN